MLLWKNCAGTFCDLKWPWRYSLWASLNLWLKRWDKRRQWAALGSSGVLGNWPDCPGPTLHTPSGLGSPYQAPGLSDIVRSRRTLVTYLACAVQLALLCLWNVLTALDSFSFCYSATVSAIHRRLVNVCWHFFLSRTMITMMDSPTCVCWKPSSLQGELLSLRITLKVVDR